MELEKILNQSKAVVTTDLSKRSDENFKYIRTLKIEKREFFIARDIADLLGYAIPRKAVREHCKKAVSFDDIFKRSKIDPLDLAPVLGNSWKQTKLIQESDIWRLILRSKLPEAEKIEDWIMEEVLPSIRKDGFYISEKAKKNPSKKLINVASSIMKTRLATVEKRKQLLALIEDFLDKQTEYKPNSFGTVISNVYQYLHIATSLKTAVLVIEENLRNSKNGLQIKSYNPKQERAYDRDYLVAVNYYSEERLAIFDRYFQSILEDVVMHLESEHITPTAKSVINILKKSGQRQLQLVTELEVGAKFQGKVRNQIDILVDDYKNGKIEYSKMIVELQKLKSGKVFKV